MILIGDSGSTKTEWVILTQTETYTYHTQGINPMFNTTEEIEYILRNELYPQLLDKTAFQKICFYGASVSTEERTDRVRKAIQAVFGTKPAEIQHDLLAAARALCGKSEGIACILGTGSNSCVYNGEKITEHIDSLAYILGDEGSGAHMGKTLLNRHYYKKLPASISIKLDEYLGKDLPGVLETIYRQPLANRYLASLTRFISEHKDTPEIKAIVTECFGEFVDILMHGYPNQKNLPVHSVGSVGYVFKDELQEVLTNKGLTAGNIIKNPMEGLIKFHMDELMS